jgi:hypothetical protein
MKTSNSMIEVFNILRKIDAEVSEKKFLDRVLQTNNILF